MLKNHKIDSRALSYIKLIHHINVYSFITREYIKIITRTFDRKRRDICLNNDNMMFLINSKLIKIMNFIFHVMKNVNLNNVNNQITNCYVNYIIKIDDENIFVQVYVINDLIVEILLNVDVIENYNIDILTSKRMIIVNNNKISMTFDKIKNIMINHIIIESTTSISINSSIKFTSMNDSFKFAFFTSSFNYSTFRINFSINKITATSQIDKKTNSMLIQKKSQMSTLFTNYLLK